ncbi:hypothetical protein [Streptomyces sp. NPDC048269]|uniref:hypothetical protein n=1 Tax=Streptomyces sp. NPDC048269 TaxID=3155753 RepID=UPI00343C5B1D
MAELAPGHRRVLARAAHLEPVDHRGVEIVLLQEAGDDHCTVDQWGQQRPYRGDVHPDVAAGRSRVVVDTGRNIDLGQVSG